jgi:hypothetical protein
VNRPRHALIVGINKYQRPANNLTSAVADAEAIAKLLGRNAEGSLNFTCRVLLDKMPDGSPITRARLREALIELFAHAKNEDVLFYFSGHGILSDLEGYLCTCDAENNDPGVPMSEVIKRANASDAANVLLILDCCHSGNIGNMGLISPGGRDSLAIVREDLTIIAASREKEVSKEGGGHGFFTAALLEALDAGAADHMGWVTAPAIYAFVERRLGSGPQRPVYKSHATRSYVVRRCEPLIERFKLDELVKLFPTEQHKFALDPDYDPEDELGNIKGKKDDEKIRRARLLKDYRDVGLVKASVPGEDFFWAARRSHAVELTPRGREYWRLVKDDKL